MIDLHTHTNESDGTLTPAELIRSAVATGLEALAITDHDTFAGYEAAMPHATAAGLDLIRGIEISTRHDGHSVHLLGYFLAGAPGESFLRWLDDLQNTRRGRNRRLAERLQSLGIDVKLEEAEQLGRTLTGRPHFARVLVTKGYAADLEEAFDKYLGEHSLAFVEREEATTAEAIQQIMGGGGLPSVAHPVRLMGAEDQVIGGLHELGLPAIEVFHSDHRPEQVSRYAALAQKFSLIPTGGSDFHGAVKPRIQLGTGFQHNLAISRDVLDRMREFAARSRN